MSGWRGAHAERIQAAQDARTAAFVAASMSERGRVASGASDRPALPNLESSSRDDLPYYSVRVLDFGEGMVEARAVFVDGRRRGRKKKGSDGGGQNVDQTIVDRERIEWRSKERMLWNRRRAARSLRYRCLALKPQYFWTFTKRGKFESVDEVRAAWGRFAKVLRARLKLEFRYVAVPELHGDGSTWHLHVAFDRHYDVVTMRALWQRALGGKGNERGDASLGNVHARYFTNRRKGALAAASYMAKYLAKGFAASGGGRKSYWCSEGLVPESVKHYVEPVGDCVLMRVRDIVMPMIPRQSMVRVWEWEYVGLHGFVISTQ